MPSLPTVLFHLLVVGAAVLALMALFSWPRCYIFGHEPVPQQQITNPRGIDEPAVRIRSVEACIWCGAVTEEGET